MKKVLYIGNFIFPDGNAAGKRVYANGKLLQDLGYDVVFVGLDKNLDRGIGLKDTEVEIDGFKNYNFKYPKNNLAWLNYYETFNALVEFIDETIDINTVEMIIYYGSPSLSLFINKLIKYAKKNRIKIISDCVDWLTIKTNNPIFNLIKWTDNTYQKAYLNRKVNGVIVISSFLKAYYEKFGKLTVTIPPLSTTINENNITRNRNSKLIVYAGIPFRKGHVIKDISALKDRIDIMIKLLYKAKKRGSKFILNIYGFTREEFLLSIPSQQKYVNGLGSSIKFHGLQANEIVVNQVAEADFTMLIRDVNRDTSAGFPTKVSESVSYGTPVITNNTSDIKNYIIEGEQGFFIDSEIEDDSVEKIVQILNLKNDDLFFLRKKCIDSKVFYYSKFSDEMREFIYLL